MTKIINLVDDTGLVVDAAVFDDAATVADGGEVTMPGDDGPMWFKPPEGTHYVWADPSKGGGGGGGIGSRVVNGDLVLPAAPAPVAVTRTATTYQLMSALTDAQWAAYPGAKPTDQRLFDARVTPWPEDNVKVGRIAAVLGTTPKAWFDAALGVAP